MFLIALFAIISPLQATIRVGRISNATWQLSPTADISQYANITERTCEQCLCLMLMTNGVSTRMACQPLAMTCQLLFSNSTVQLMVKETSMVYLLSELDQNWMTTDQQPMTTATTFFRKNRPLLFCFSDGYWVAYHCWRHPIRSVHGFSAVCNPACLNGGVCIGTNLCQCPSNLWVGSYCQTRKSMALLVDRGSKVRILQYLQLRALYGNSITISTIPMECFLVSAWMDQRFNLQASTVLVPVSIWTVQLVKPFEFHRHHFLVWWMFHSQSVRGW